ncbi:MAG: hypothetical protein LBM93_08685 [Oscillospiraceae bacterium]|jgi:hypothetical protein|nr:hypothetical protein [Oscillospiraceae bacterium]
MDITQITPLFILFSGQNDVEIYTPIIQNAIREVQSMLKVGTNQTDERLPFVAASVANYRYTQITAARDKIAYTPAGKIDETHNGIQQFDFAKSLMEQYMCSIKDLLKDDCFSFTGIS